MKNGVTNIRRAMMARTIPSLIKSWTTSAIGLATSRHGPSKHEVDVPMASIARGGQKNLTGRLPSQGTWG